MKTEDIDKSPDQGTMSDEELDALFQAEGQHEAGATQRAEKILTASKHEVGMRDLMTHMLLRVWQPLLSIGAIFFVACHRRKKNKT